MNKVKDLTGRQFGRLTVIKQAGTDRQHRTIWQCTCACGNTTKVISNSLTSGATKSCGCLQREMAAKAGTLDITNQIFGNLKALESTNKRSHRKIIWKCLCLKCNQLIFVTASDLRNGHSTQCRACRAKSNIVDLTNQTFGNLKAIKPTNSRSGSNVMWECVCLKCGSVVLVRGSNLRNGNSTQCKSCRLKELQQITRSKAETALVTALKTLGYRLTTQLQLENRYFDIFLIDHQLLIESDGRYWHRTDEQKSNDEYKTKLAQKYGYQLLRVVNDNKSNDIQNAITKIQKTIKAYD